MASIAMNTTINPVRSVLAVLGGIVLISLVVESVEFMVVNATATEPLIDFADYFAVRNRPGILGAKLVYNTAAALLGGYMVAKIAGYAELLHAGVAALIQTAVLVSSAFGQGEYAQYTPGWMWVALVVLTGPAMMGGAAVRARAARVEDTPMEDVS